MAAGDSTKLIIELEVLLRNLSRTLNGLNKIEQSLRRVASIRVNASQAASSQRAALTAQRLALTQQRLQLQQQRLQISTQNVATAQGRASVAAGRLTLAQQRLAQAQQRATQTAQGLNIQQNHHVQFFRAAQQAAQQFNRQILAMGNALRSVGQGLASFGATLSISVSAPLAALGAGVVDAAVKMDSLKRGLTTIAGSSQEAAVQLERLTQLAKLPGIGFEEAIQGSIRLQAVGFSAAEAEKALRQFSNAIALTGGGREQLENVTVQLGQMAAQSKVLAQDLKPIISSAPAVAVALREAFGTVRSEELQELGVTSKEFIDILVRQLERLPRAAAGARNSFENFRDEVFRAAATIGTTLLPALTRLAEVAGPVITAIANAFAALPGPLQVIVVAFTGLLAVIGPVVFVIGQLTLGVGRLIVGFAELNATGILPTVASLRALTVGSLNAAAAQRTLAASTALVAGGVGLVLTAITAVVAGFAIYKAFQKDSITLSREQANALTDQITGLREQLKFVVNLQSSVKRTADEQQRLLEIYNDLNTAAKIRISSITDEEERLEALRQELQKLITLREQERIQQAASIAAELANSILLIQANEKSRQSIAGRIAANSALIETLEREGRITQETGKQLERLGITAGGDVRQAIAALQKESERLVDRQSELISASKELNDKTKDQVAIVQTLEQQTGLTARELLNVAQNMGRFRGDVQAIIPVLEGYIQKTDEATNATDKFNRALSQNERLLNEAGKRADDAAKARRTLIGSAAAVARETSVDFAGALKSLRQMVDAVPALRKALERERELTGKSLEELLREALDDAFKGRDKTKSETGLRNARQQLADALAQVALAESEQEVEIEKEKNAALLRAAEAGQRLRIISYREFLQLRASLAAEDLDREIKQQVAIVEAARNAQLRLLTESRKAGIPAAERTRREAQAAAAREEAIRAEGKLKILTEQRERLEVELAQEIKLSQDQQLKDTRQLETQYAQLRDKVAEAMKAATVEEFRESLEELGKAQEFLNKQIQKASAARKGELVEDLERARRLNQRQIEAIHNIIRQRDALAELAGAEAVVEAAKKRQSNLEEELRNDVELRGLSEEAAIRRRLAGEIELRAELTKQRDAVEAVALALFDAGRTVPKGLTDFIAQTDLLIDRLGKLTFTEQFRLAEKEFQRLNDERLRRIADVERAVNNRTIAEAEGLLLIRRINGEYVGDLEQQLALLKEIAAASNDVNLQRQAQSAEETVKDAGDKLADFNKQLRSTAIDSLRSGFINLFQNLRDNTISAKERLLDLIDSVVNRINEVIAERLFDKFIESLTTGGKDGGILGKIGEFLGFGDGKAVGTTVANTTATQANTAAINALTTAFGGQAAGGIGGVIAAGAGGGGDAGKQGGGFLRKVASVLLGGIPGTSGVGVGTGATGDTVISALSSNTESLKQLTQSVNVLIKVMGGVAPTAATGISDFLSSFLSGGAATGLFPAVPGGVYKVVEGGFPEAVLTTDPKHAARQVAILRAFLRETRGLGGRIRGLAAGGFAMPDLSLNVPSVSLPSGNFSDMEISRSQPINLRNINLFDRREMVRGYMRSAEGTQDLLNLVSEQADEIGRRIKVR